MTPQSFARHYLFDAHLAIGSVTLFIALLHLYVAYRGIRRDLNFPFAAASFLVACEALTGSGQYISSTVQGSIFWWKLSWVFVPDSGHPGNGPFRRLALAHAAQAPEERDAGADPMAAQHHGRHPARGRRLGRTLVSADPLTGGSAALSDSLTLPEAPAGDAR